MLRSTQRLTTTTNRLQTRASPLKPILVGAGVVGTAIFGAHIDAGVDAVLADVDGDRLIAAKRLLDQRSVPHEPYDIGLPNLQAIRSRLNDGDFGGPAIIIESIAEKLALKQAFFQEAERAFGPDAVFCSNTSTLQISDIAAALGTSNRLCGMHFFMPVNARSAVEIISHESTDSSVTDVCQQHAARIRKQPLLVQDSPGFIVNRLLSPYLNQSLLLLAHGVDHKQIERASRAYGVPLSPLELIDWIGTRTMFDAGRVFWQSFPGRIDPSPIVPALIKRKRLGRTLGGGLYDYDGQQRSMDLSSVTKQLVEMYALELLNLSDDDVVNLLAIPMWIESKHVLAQKVAGSESDINLAMQGGLGYQGDQPWSDFFRAMGDQKINQQSEQWSAKFKSMRQALQ